MDDFVGHPAENQFVIITIPGKATQLKEHIVERLTQAMTYFYPIHDREAGYVKRGGEDGSKEKVPFPWSHLHGTLPAGSKILQCG